MKKKYGLALSFIIPVTATLWGFLYYKILYCNNMLISLDDMSSDILSIFLQHTIVNLPIILSFAAAIKMTGSKSLFLNMPPRKILLAVCVMVYCVLFFYALRVNNNSVKVLYTFIFYLLFVAFMEEYLYRGLMSALLKNKLPNVLERILPNILFTLSHYVMLFVETSGIDGITAADLAVFFITTLLFGVVMELLKRKSDSLYIAIFVHAIYDFYGEIMLWL